MPDRVPLRTGLVKVLFVKVSEPVNDVKLALCSAVLNSANVPVTVLASKSNNQNVTVTDIKMPFGSMVEFMVKWVIASIPAFIILFLIGMMVMGVFGVGIATLFK